MLYLKESEFDSSSSRYNFLNPPTSESEDDETVETDSQYKKSKPLVSFQCPILVSFKAIQKPTYIIESFKSISNANETQRARSNATSPARQQMETTTPINVIASTASFISSVSSASTQQTSQASSSTSLNAPPSSTLLNSNDSNSINNSANQLNSSNPQLSLQIRNIEVAVQRHEEEIRGFQALQNYPSVFVRFF